MVGTLKNNQQFNFPKGQGEQASSHDDRYNEDETAGFTNLILVHGVSSNVYNSAK